MGSLELSANVVQAPKTGSVDAPTSSSSGGGELCDKWYSGKLAGFLFWGKKASDAEVISCVEKVGVNFRSRYGSTPINHAVSYPHVSVSRLILLRSLGADVNIPDNFGNTPLIRAAAGSSNPQVILYLISEGADISSLDKRNDALKALQRNRFGLWENEEMKVALGWTPSEETEFLQDKNNKISSNNSVGKAAHELILESVQFYEAYNLLKSGYYFEAIDQFKKSGDKGNPVSLIYLVVNLSEEGMTEYTPKLKDACTNLLKNYPDYLELWENEAPLYAALAICNSTSRKNSAKFLEKADLLHDPFAMFVKGYIEYGEDSQTSKNEKIKYFKEATLFGYCPAALFLAGTYLKEDTEINLKPLPNEAYAWNHAAKLFGCSVTMFESDFDQYSELNKEFAQKLGVDFLKKIETNIAKLKNKSGRNIFADYKKKFERLRNIDLFGDDLSERGYKGINFTECETLCSINDECVAYTYLTTKRWCFLKNGLGKATQKSTTISGILTTYEGSIVGQKLAVSNTEELYRLVENKRISVANIIEDAQQFCDAKIELEDNAVSYLDITLNGKIDIIVVDRGGFSCPNSQSIFCGSAGCRIHFIAADDQIDGMAQGWSAVEDQNGEKFILLGLHGSACDKSGFETCYKKLSLIDGQFIVSESVDGGFSDATGDALIENLKDIIDGVGLSELTGSLREEYEIDPTISGVLVVSVDKLSSAFANGLREGDLITDIAQKRVKTVEDVKAIISDIRSSDSQSMLLLVKRGDELRFLILKLG